MGVLSESLCFCKGVGKTERTKAAIFSSKAPSMARISGTANGISGTGFLIHRNLLLTTHLNLPSVTAAESSEICLQNDVAATLVPHRFFITSSVLDLTIVGLDVVDGDSNAQGQPHYLKTCSKTNLDLGNAVYFLGYSEKKELTVGEGKVVIATDNLIKLSTDGIVWSPGSAGFDAHANLAFMICDPMKLAKSPNAMSSSTSSSSSSSWKKDSPMQFGIPMPIICDWLNQHWEGSLDELTKPKLPIIRLMSSGQKSDQSCASFSMRQVFKSADADNEGTPSSSNIVSKTRNQAVPSCSAAANAIEEEVALSDIHRTHTQGIPTPEIYESPKLTAVPVRKKETASIQLLDINFPPKVVKAGITPQLVRQLSVNSNENRGNEVRLQNTSRDENAIKSRLNLRPSADAEVESTGSVNGGPSDIQSSSSPVEVSEMHNGYYSSEGETTMYSAETAESRNYTSPREGEFQQVGRSQSCVSYNRWRHVPNPAAHLAMPEKQRSFLLGKKTYSQGANYQRSSDYFSPTVSSIMKKRNNSERQPSKPRPSAVHSSPRWNF